jgi:hypothetical protein
VDWKYIENILPADGKVNFALGKNQSRTGGSSRTPDHAVAISRRFPTLLGRAVGCRSTAALGCATSAHSGGWLMISQCVKW